MIKTTEELIHSTAKAVVIETGLAKQIAEETGLGFLKELSNTDKESFLLTRDRIDTIVKKLNPTDKMAPVRALRKSKGGRHRLPEPTAEEVANMSPEERLRYNNRVWQRNSRKARGIGTPND